MLVSRDSRDKIPNEQYVYGVDVCNLKFEWLKAVALHLTMKTIRYDNAWK